MMNDLYDRDVLNEKVGRFFDTELDQLLKNDVNFYLSSSAPDSPLAKTWNKQMKDLEDEVLSPDNADVKYYVGQKPQEPNAKDKTIFDLLVQLGLLPDQEQINKFKMRFKDG